MLRGVGDGHFGETRYLFGLLGIFVGSAHLAAQQLLALHATQQQPHVLSRLPLREVLLEHLHACTALARSRYVTSLRNLA